MKIHCLSIQHRCFPIASRGSLGESPHFPLCLKHKVWVALTFEESYYYHTPATALLIIPQWTVAKIFAIVSWKSFRYDLSQIPADYTAEMTNGITRLDLIDRVPEELWTEVHSIVQEAVIKIFPKKKKCKKAKWSEEALQIAQKRS